jgi:hypothetical protein
LYRPLTLFMWAALARVTDMETTWPFHLLSILANAWVVVMIYLLVCRFWGRPRAAFVAAFIFALHPLHSEAVAWISPRVAAGRAATAWLRETLGDEAKAVDPGPPRQRPSPQP